MTRSSSSPCLRTSRNRICGIKKSGISRSTVAGRRGIRISPLFVGGSFLYLLLPCVFFAAGFVLFPLSPDPVRHGSCFLIVFHPYHFTSLIFVCSSAMQS